MSLQYPLLFPYGEYGYDERIPYEVTASSKIKREHITMRAHHIQTRPTEGMPIIKSGRLLHQYIVDAYTSTEQERLRFIRHNQKKLRAELYSNVCDALDCGDTDASHVGNKVVLPSSFTGGPRYMSEKYQDAMAICHVYGGDSPNNRPDLECRVFKLKLEEMMSDVKKGVFFPKPAAVVNTIEFQKCGLPHAHILLWFDGEETAAVIDQYISAQLPDKEKDREGFDLVERHMIHGPYGTQRPLSPCMEKGVCTKKFPKPYSNHTNIDKSGFVVYKRWIDTTSFVLKGDIKLDNRYVVPHNLALLKKYQVHINIELCCKTSAIKYLFKYITKGVDRALALLERSGCKSKAELEKKKQLEMDEIDRFLECRYISACEASWRLFFVSPFRSKTYTTSPRKTQAANQTYEKVRELTYIQFPSRFVYHSDEKIWTPRKQRIAIGRVIYVHPASGDLYYLRILVNVVKGPFSFDALLTVGSTKYEEYRDVCYVLGLLDDDKEWHDAIVEPSYWDTGHQLRRLFVTILIHCKVGNPLKLWEHSWKILAEDILYMKQREFSFPGLVLEDAQLQQYTLIEVERLLKENDKSLTDFPSMPKPDRSVLQEISIRVLQEELNYDTEKEAAEHAKLFCTMNEDQQNIYNSVIDSVENKSGQLFFVYGAGGTGKTFLYKTIIAKLRSVGKVVLPVASAGIAALLLPGGRTAHSRFKFPLALSDTTVCEITAGSALAMLLDKTDLIIWDEAPMAHRHAFETLDRTLRDLQFRKNPEAADKPFGGKTVVLGGDFRQILPVIPQGSRHDTVQASISKSYLWQFAQIHSLSINMSLKQADIEFANWILEVGNGTAATVATEGRSEEEADQVIIDDRFMVPRSDHPHESISDAAYPNFVNNYLNRAYLTERAILAPTNAIAHEINSYLLSKVPSVEKEYLSSDSVVFESTPEDDWTNNYTQEYLNSLEFPGLPTLKLCLKVGAPVMMLRNLNQRNGLCNGTRMMILRMGHRVLEAELLTGTHSQEQSLKQVVIYLPRPVFSHAQLYVALSRVTTPDGLKILDDTEGGTREIAVTNIVYREIFKNIRSFTDLVL
ncbi:LOW QUALITY PROTEIN: hypothetical protein N665_0532s0030 [Sinapis alba]|nr:LOW QUALITY PROTEIN: hypothetical protein N665_0532s0030 [Sinapis alba]